MSIEPLLPEAAYLVESPEVQLARIEEVRDVVLGQSDFPGTYHEYAKLTGLGAALRQYKDTSVTAMWEITLICRQAERKMGQMLREIPRHPGARTDITSSGNQIRLYGQVIEELGIDHNRAYSWQQAAQGPEEDFLALVEQRRSMGWTVTLENVIGVGQRHRNREAWEQAAEEARRRGKEEILPRAKELAKSIPSLAEFEQRLEEEVGPVQDAHARGAITRLIRRRYGEELKERKERDNERREKGSVSVEERFPEPSREESELKQDIWIFDQINKGISYLGMMHKRDFPFWEKVAALKLVEKNVRREKAERGAKVENPGDYGTVAHATSFTAEDVRLAIAYLEVVLKEMEADQ